LQVQFVKAVLPAGEVELDEQAMHVELAEALTAVEYLPAPQVTHADALAGEYLPAPQLIQLVALVAPVAPEYVPGGHVVHDGSEEEPNIPAGQVRGPHQP
jgi:hypothetical protein